MIRISDNELKERAKKVKYFFSDIDGTLTDGTSVYTANGEYAKSFSLRDGAGVYLLKKTGIEVGFITGENSEIVQKRAEKLKLKYCFSGIDNKLQCMSDFCSNLNITLDEIGRASCRERV